MHLRPLSVLAAASLAFRKVMQRFPESSFAANTAQRLTALHTGEAAALLDDDQERMMRLNFLPMLALATFACAVVATPVAAAKSPYADLLPASLAVKDATDRLDPALLQRSVLAVVPSSRFVKQATTWQKRWGEKGDESHVFALGLKRESAKIGATAMDPRRVLDAAMAGLQPRFADVKVFDDLASAREAGARYYLLLDYNSAHSPPFMGIPGTVRGNAGALLLDGAFQRHFEIAIDKQNPWHDGPMLGGANSSMMAWSKAVDDNFAILLPALTTAMNAAFAERGAPMPLAAPAPAPVQQAAPVLAAAAAPASVDPGFLPMLAATPSAGELYAIGDEMAEKAQVPQAALAFREVMKRFPDNPLSLKAAERLAALPR